MLILTNAMFKKECKPGDVVIKQGDDGDNFYIIESGTADVYVSGIDAITPPDTEGEQTHADHGGRVQVVSVSDSFGELALMYSSPRAATIVCRCESLLLDSSSHLLSRAAVQAAAAAEIALVVCLVCLVVRFASARVCNRQRTHSSKIDSPLGRGCSTLFVASRCTNKQRNVLPGTTQHGHGAVGCRSPVVPVRKRAAARKLTIPLSPQGT